MPPFDETNPWHVQADFVFMFQCEAATCSAVLDFGDLAAGQRQSLSLPDLCVALADLAQLRRWTCYGPLRFRCPTCSAGRLLG